MQDPGESDSKRMRLRYDGVCRVCGADLTARSEAFYERSTKTVRCLEHDTPPPPPSSEPVDVGSPGSSARREFERRRSARDRRVRERHPKIGGFLLAITDDPQSTTAWDTGAWGEERLGARLNQLAGESLRVLHDRRVPRSRTNIDHIAIAPSGVYVIDAKRYKGRPALKVEGGLMRPRVEKLMVAGRDRTKLVDGVIKQVDLVRGIVGAEIPLRGVLCFIEADWPLIGGAFTTRGIHTVWPRKLYKQLGAPGPLGHEQLSALQGSLAQALPSA